MLDGTEFYECRCFSDEHVIKFTLDLDPEDRTIYTSMYMRPDWRWWRRVWMAIRYVFGYSSKYGHFDCYLMRPEDAQRLRAMLDRFIEAK